MKTIQLTDEQYQALLNGESVKIEPPIKKWQPKNGNYYIASYGQVETGQSTITARNFGTVYPTKEQAEKARDAMRTHNRLLAWLAENDDGFVADWNNSKQAKFSLFQNVYNGFWSFENNTQYMKLGTVYMSYQNADKLCKLLNDGMIEL